MQAYPNAPYPAAGPVRFAMPPNGYRQQYPPFTNRAYDRYAAVPTTYRAPMNRPVHYPPSYGPGYGPNGPSTQGGGANLTAPGGQKKTVTTTTTTRTTTQGQKQGQQHLFNPNGTKKAGSPLGGPGGKTPLGKKGPREFKDSAFTIESDGAQNDAIRGLVSNDDINNLLKHKGTKVKVSKIYRITKTKPEEISDDDEPPPPPPPLKAAKPRPPSADSYCSECDGRPCSQCAMQSSHVYDDCPLCRAQLAQTHAYDDCPECRAQRQTHTYDDCPQCREERARELARRN